MTDDWRTHIHEPNDPWAYQHGPNLHTHGTDGKIDTVMGIAVPALHELERARLERAAAGQGPNEIEPCETCGGSGKLPVVVFDPVRVVDELSCYRCLGIGVK